MVLWSSTAIYAQTIPEEEGEEVIITETPPPVTGPIRNPVLIPISVTYYSSIATIGLEFMDLIGEVSVSISNLSTTESYNTVVYSQNGWIQGPAISDSSISNNLYSKQKHENTENPFLCNNGNHCSAHFLCRFYRTTFAFNKFHIGITKLRNESHHKPAQPWHHKT